MSAASTRRPKPFYRPRTLIVVTVLGYILLLAPVAVVIVYSFNSSKSLYVLDGFSLRWYREFFTNEDIISSVVLSLKIATACMVLSAVIGTSLAFGLRGASKWLTRPMDGVVFLRLVSPEIATAVASLLLFTQLGVTLSNGTITVSHVAFSFVYITVIVASQLAGLDPELELAAQDLGASRVGAVRLVALPLVLPAIAASSLLVFIFSFDDFVTSYFTSGVGVPPLPVRIYAMLRFGLTPVVNAIGVVMLVASIALALAAVGLLSLQNRRTRGRR